MTSNLLLIEKTASELFHINTVKPFQLLVMDRILSQTQTDEVKNQIVILPTGTGKSLCFLLPASIISNLTVIVYPLLALMNDQIKKLQEANIDCVCLRGGQSKTERDEIFKKLKDGTKIIITNPETLNQASILRKLRQFKTELLVVDEAHVISQWGKDFRPAYNQLSDAVKALKPHQILAFTATASDNTVSVIEECLLLKDPVVVRGDADRENIFYSAYPAYDRLSAIREILSFCKRPAIVFCPVRHETYDFCIKFKRIMPQIPMFYYHAGLSKSERKAIEQAFMDCDNGILFATCAYGMGIDKKNIRTVIHSSLPASIESYLQESGRAGRDREKAYAYVIITPKDSSPLAEIFRNRECRRYQLLKAIGQDKETCTGCDVCNKQVIDSLYGEKQITALIKRYPNKYTAKTAAMLLCGNRTIHTHNPFYNVLETEEEFAERTIDNMPFVKNPQGRLKYYQMP